MEDRHYAARISLEKWNELLEGTHSFTVVTVSVSPEEKDPKQFNLLAGSIREVLSGYFPRALAIPVNGSSHQLWTSKNLLENVVEVTVVSE